MSTTFDFRSGAARKTATVAVAMTEGQRAEVHAAMRKAGFTYPSEGMRALLLGFARDANIRAEVDRWIRQQMPGYDRE